MSEQVESKLCPFCGTSGTLKLMLPDHIGCLWCGVSAMPITKWQQRSLEDALQKKLDIAVLAIRSIYAGAYTQDTIQGYCRHILADLDPTDET